MTEFTPGRSAASGSGAGPDRSVTRLAHRARHSIGEQVRLFLHQSAQLLQFAAQFRFLLRDLPLLLGHRFVQFRGPVPAQTPIPPPGPRVPASSADNCSALIVMAQSSAAV